MPGMDRLPLEEALEDSPQTRCLLGVFEEDSSLFDSYSSRLLQAAQRLHAAQTELSAATQNLSRQVLNYTSQHFPLGGDDEVMTSTVQHFAKVIDELSSQHAIVSSQLADAVMFPIMQFREKELADILSLRQMMTAATVELDGAIIKYSRLSKRRDNEKVRGEVSEDVYSCRKKLHQVSLQYYAALNALQFRKKIITLEPMLGYLQAQMSFFRMGSEYLTPQVEQFVSNICTSVQSVRGELDAEQGATAVTTEALQEASDALYCPDPIGEPDRTLTQRAGYLFLRQKTGLVSFTWERLFFFTQGGNLMSQRRDALAGGLVMDLDNCSVMAAEPDDRRNCFQITVFDGKRSVILQADSRKDCEEWIATISNISRQIYLAEDPQALAAQVQRVAMNAVTPSPSFQERHNILRPITSPSSWGSVSMPTDTPSSHPSSPEPKGPSQPLVALGTPIQFDISPGNEEEEEVKEEGAASPTGRRHNPFGEGESGGDAQDCVLHQLFVVRFLGCMAVNPESSIDAPAIYETMRQVMAARAIHSIFRMAEFHLLITSQSLRLIDPQTQVTRITFPVDQVGACISHKDNPRLFGFIIHGIGGRQTAGECRVPQVVQPSCYVFESNDEGEKICDSVGLAKQISLHTNLERRVSEGERKKQKEIEKEQRVSEDERERQKEIEKDLEQQSRLISASSKSIDLSPADRNVRSDTAVPGMDEENGAESEA
uniref:DCC-interacting protein 13-alpha n=1 Tax=Eptatretus burgeri TaxID=7764 RepID=A0A8C4R2Y5_EPTBU